MKTKTKTKTLKEELKGERRKKKRKLLAFEKKILNNEMKRLFLYYAF